MRSASVRTSRRSRPSSNHSPCEVPDAQLDAQGRPAVQARVAPAIRPDRDGATDPQAAGVLGPREVQRAVRGALVHHRLILDVDGPYPRVLRSGPPAAPGAVRHRTVARPTARPGSAAAVELPDRRALTPLLQAVHRCIRSWRSDLAPDERLHTVPDRTHDQVADRDRDRGAAARADLP